MSSTTAPAEGSTGRNWLGIATSPNVANTAVRASSSGMPAASNAPNAITRITSVIGSDRSPAFERSSSNAVSIAVDRARLAELADVEPGMGLLGLVHLVEDRAELVGGLVGLAGDLELDERGACRPPRPGRC